MKKYHLLSALAMGTFLAGCTSDELIDKSQLGNAMNSDGRISFTQKVGNLTRAASGTHDMEETHYEFGVFGYKGSSAPVTRNESSRIMENYLVAYGASTHYNALAQNATTYVETVGSEPTSGSITDLVSTWFYEGLDAASNNVTFTKPDLTQSLKYWDQAMAHTDFIAYTPYLNQFAVIPAANQATAKSVTFDETNDKILYTNLSSFYTDNFKTSALGGEPTNSQVSSAAGKSKTYNNAEYINDNEALYAYTNVPKDKYNKDVQLEFKHVNAKINIAFWEKVDGYKVEIIDLIPEDVKGSTTRNEAYEGIALTPALKTQAAWYEDAARTTVQKQAQEKATPEVLPYYLKESNVTVSNIATGAGDGLNTGNHTSGMTTLTAGTVTLVDFASNTATTTDNGGAGTQARGLSNENLRFNAADKDAASANLTNINNISTTVASATKVTNVNVISEAGAGSASKSSTTLYVLPNHNGTNYITATAAGVYGATAKVADNTGYTLHVSYRLIPEDGSASTTIYDARVYVAPEYCKWEAGKAYTYIFKITKNTNGTTDPALVDPANTSVTYVDPSDPRVPEDPALKPIVFDGIYVTDYIAANTTWVNADGENDTWIISDASTWSKLTLSSVNYNYLAMGISAADYKTALNKAYTPVSVWASASFDYATRSFKLTSDDPTIVLPATANSTTNLKYREMTYSGMTAEQIAAYEAAYDADATTSYPTYLMNIWSAVDGTTAETYTATPNVASIVVTGSTTSIERFYRIESGTYYGYTEVKKVDGVTEYTKYYSITATTTVPTYGAPGTNVTEITSAAYGALLGTTAGTATTSNKTHEFSWAKPTTYTVSHAPAGSAPTIAYPVVKPLP